MRPITSIIACFVLSTSTVALAQGEFLDDGGGVSSGYDIGFDAGDDGFLAGGGGIERYEGLRTGDREFLADGGGISTGIDRFTSEREEFLEDGGGITSTARVVPVPRTRYYDTANETRAIRARASRGSRGAVRFLGKPETKIWRGLAGPLVRTSRSGSFLTVSAAPRRMSSEQARSAEARAGQYANPGPHVIDIEAERLDKRPYPASGIDVVITGGGSKIIRIAPGS